MTASTQHSVTVDVSEARLSNPVPADRPVEVVVTNAGGCACFCGMRFPLGSRPDSIPPRFLANDLRWFRSVVITPITVTDDHVAGEDATGTGTSATKEKNGDTPARPRSRSRSRSIVQIRSEYEEELLSAEERGATTSPGRRSRSNTMKGRAPIRVVMASNMTSVTEIGDCFLADGNRITGVDFAKLGKVTTVGMGFMTGCTALQEASFSGMASLRRVGDSFMSGCKSLTTITLGDWPTIVSLGSYFLDNCTSLTSFHLGNMPLLTTIGSGFLRGCSALREVSLSHSSQLKTLPMNFLSGLPVERVLLSELSGLTSVGSGFLRGCTELTTITLPKSLKAASEGFMAKCDNLLEFDGTHLAFENIRGDFLAESQRLSKVVINASRLSSIGKRFLCECRSLAEVEFVTAASSPSRGESRTNRTLMRVGDGFLEGCRALASVDLRTLGAVQEIGDRFLINTTNLIHVDLTPLRSVKSVGSSFLGFCGAMALDVAPLAGLTSVGPRFMEGSRAFELDLSPMVSLTRIGSGFLHAASCFKLTLPRIAPGGTISNEFLHGMRALTEVSLEPLANVEAIPPGFLEECASLTVIDLAPLANVRRVGPEFLTGCVKLKEIRHVAWSNGALSHRVNEAAALAGIQLGLPTPATARKPAVDLPPVTNLSLSLAPSTGTVDDPPTQPATPTPKGKPMGGRKVIIDHDLI